MQELEYHVTREDIIRLKRHDLFAAYINNPASKYVFWLLFTLQAVSPAYHGDYAMALLIAVSWLFIFAHLIYPKSRWSSFIESCITRVIILADFGRRILPGETGLHRISMTEECVEVVSSCRKSRFLWEGISAIYEDYYYIYIYTGPHRGHVIHKKHFSSEHHAQIFLSRAKTMQQHARLADRKSLALLSEESPALTVPASDIARHVNEG